MDNKVYTEFDAGVAKLQEQLAHLCVGNVVQVGTDPTWWGPVESTAYQPDPVTGEPHWLISYDTTSTAGVRGVVTHDVRDVVSLKTPVGFPERPTTTSRETALAVTPPEFPAVTVVKNNPCGFSAYTVTWHNPMTYLPGKLMINGVAQQLTLAVESYLVAANGGRTQAAPDLVLPLTCMGQLSTLTIDNLIASTAYQLQFRYKFIVTAAPGIAVHGFFGAVTQGPVLDAIPAFPVVSVAPYGVTPPVGTRSPYNCLVLRWTNPAPEVYASFFVRVARVDSQGIETVLSPDNLAVIAGATQTFEVTGLSPGAAVNLKLQYKSSTLGGAGVATLVTGQTRSQAPVPANAISDLLVGISAGAYASTSMCAALSIAYVVNEQTVTITQGVTAALSTEVKVSRVADGVTILTQTYPHASLGTKAISLSDEVILRNTEYRVVAIPQYTDPYTGLVVKASSGPTATAAALAYLAPPKPTIVRIYKETYVASWGPTYTRVKAEVTVPYAMPTTWKLCYAYTDTVGATLYSSDIADAVFNGASYTFIVDEFFNVGETCTLHVWTVNADQPGMRAAYRAYGDGLFPDGVTRFVNSLTMASAAKAPYTSCNFDSNALGPDSGGLIPGVRFPITGQQFTSDAATATLTYGFEGAITDYVRTVQQDTTNAAESRNSISGAVEKVVVTFDRAMPTGTILGYAWARDNVALSGWEGRTTTARDAVGINNTFGLADATSSAWTDQYDSLGLFRAAADKDNVSGQSSHTILFSNLSPGKLYNYAIYFLSGSTVVCRQGGSFLAAIPNCLFGDGWSPNIYQNWKEYNCTNDGDALRWRDSSRAYVIGGVWNNDTDVAASLKVPTTKWEVAYAVYRTILPSMGTAQTVMAGGVSWLIMYAFDEDITWDTGTRSSGFLGQPDRDCCIYTYEGMIRSLRTGARVGKPVRLWIPNTDLGETGSNWSTCIQRFDGYDV